MAEQIEQEEEWVAPALFHHAKAVYERMLMQSRLVRVDKETDDDEPSEEGDMVVYEGALTALVTQQLHLSIPYYTHVTRALKAMGCIKQLRRGGGQGLSQWQLLQEPTEELFQQINPETNVAMRRRASRNEVIEQRLKDITDRIEVLEDFMQQIIDHFGTEEVKDNG